MLTKKGSSGSSLLTDACDPISLKLGMMKVRVTLSSTQGDEKCTTCAIISVAKLLKDVM